MANKITQFTEDVEVIQKLGDHPNTDDGISADELKAKFDRAGSAIKQYLNEQVVPAVQDLQEGIAKVDKTLTQEGYFADAKATGDAIAKAKEDVKAEADRAAESAAAAAESAAGSAAKANQAVEAAEAAVEAAEEAAGRAAEDAVESISAVCYTPQDLPEEKKAQARDNIGAANALMLSNVPNSTQAVTFNEDGTIQKVQHKGVDGTVLRTDSYVYSGDTITETRTLANGETMTFILNTTTLAMEVQ